MSQPPPSTAPAAAPAVKRQRANSLGEPSKRKYKQKQQQQQQQPGDTPSADNGVEMAALRKEVADLKSVVTIQQRTINNLVSRLNDVLSAFGLQPVQFDQSPSVPSSLSSSGGAIAMDTQAVGASPGSHQQQQSSSSGQSGPRSQPVPRQPTTRAIRENVIAAVYVDQAARDRRAASFIVSGLPTSTDLPDNAIVAQLCSSELGLQPDITATKRLGKPTAGKIQPILVHTKDTQGAQSVITNAKKLRQSNFPFIKSSVYINSNLTKAEAMASYEMRCRRRQAAQAKATHNSTINATAALSQIPPPQTSTINFNLSAPAYQPTTSTSQQ